MKLKRILFYPKQIAILTAMANNYAPPPAIGVAVDDMNREFYVMVRPRFDK